DHVQRFGFVEIEGGGDYGYGRELFRQMLEAHGLKLICSFSEYKALRDDIEGVISKAKSFGAQYVVCSWIPHDKGKFSEQNCRDAAGVFNQTGEKLKAAGIRFAYHPHGFEFQPYRDGTLFDLMATETKPEFVTFEMDVFWVAHGGADPVGLMRK